MKLGELKNRRDEIIQRQLEIEQELKEMKRKYVVEGFEYPHSVRVTLEAENANLSVEKNKVIMQIHSFKKYEQHLRKSALTFVLIKMLEEKGMSEIVKEAERVSNDMLLSINQ